MGTVRQRKGDNYNELDSMDYYSSAGPNVLE